MGKRMDSHLGFLRAIYLVISSDYGLGTKMDFVMGCAMETRWLMAIMTDFLTEKVTDLRWAKGLEKCLGLGMD